MSDKNVGDSLGVEDKYEAMKAVATLLAVPVFLLLNILAAGWAFSTLWGWFVVPLGVMEIGIPTAAGIDLLIGFSTYKSTYAENDREWWHNATITLIAAPITVALGWIIHLFM